MRIKILAPATFRSDVSNTEIGPYEALQFSAAYSVDYAFTTDWDDADVILVGSAGNTFGKHMLQFCQSDKYKRYRDKCYAISTTDVEYPTLPGLYTSVKGEKFRNGYSAPIHYVTSNVARWDWKPLSWNDRNVPISFIGSSATHPVRSEMMKVHWPEGSIVEDVWAKGGKPWWSNDGGFIVQRQERYAEVMLRTKYALCPRGRSANSIRIYEAMESGCIPIIVADEIHLPSGPDWDRFVLRVKVDGMPSLGQMLLDMADGELKSKIARMEWEKHFHPKKAIDYIMVMLNNIRQTSAVERNGIARRNQIAAKLHSALSKARKLAKGI